jgi:hypothetical protein
LPLKHGHGSGVLMPESAELQGSYIAHMNKHRYATVKKTQSLEVVDRRNMPFCIMDGGEVLRQRLCHRKTALLIRDTAGRALLAFRPESDGFTFSSVACVRAGQSYETCARDALRDDWNLTGNRLLLLRIYPPCPENQYAFTAIFEVRLQAARAEAISHDPQHRLLLDYDELKGLSAHFSEIFTPFMRIAIQNGYVRPR